MATGRVPLAALRPFRLEGVRDTGETIGNGSYATVKELDFRGLKCVGKKIHDFMYRLANPLEKVAMLERFASECDLLSRLHHPCIVQFLGVYFESDSQLPVMVMEYLHTTVSACLDKGVLPEEISYEILLDVVLGLRYLHEYSPPIVHRDLSANNVLLTPNMNAKISDLGVAKILDLSLVRMGQMTQTQTPGTPCYMPPEAMIARPKYTNKVDIFSFGVMMVHMLSGRWPIPGEAFQEDPNDPNLNVPLSEFERRVEYLQGISWDHPLMGLIRRCLNNVQSRRPEAVVIYEHIKTILAGFTPSFPNRSDMLQQISILSGQVERLSVGGGEAPQPQKGSQLILKERELEVTREELRAKEREIANLQSTNAQLRTQSSMSLLLSPQFRLRWGRCADMPVAMTYPHMVRIGNDIYTGGGYSASATHGCTVSRYISAGDTWSALPRCPTVQFGLIEHNGKPVLVGGVETGATPTGDVYTLEDSREWRRSLPPLPTARFDLAIFCYKSFIIACGGVTSLTDRSNYTRTTAVEVFSSETSQWYKAEPLPIGLSAMSYVIIDDTCYLIGGTTGQGLTNRAFCAFLPSLIQQATAQAKPQSPTASQSSSSSPPAIWREIAECPCYGSTAARLGDCLLAIGGQLFRSTDGTTLVHLYSPGTSSWVQVSNADIPEPRYCAAATQFDSGDIILTGGELTHDELCKAVFVGSIEEYCSLHP